MTGLATRYLSLVETARHFGVAKSTIRDWIRRKLLAARRDAVTGRVYVPLDAIKAREEDLKDWQPNETPENLRKPQADKAPEPPDPPAEDPKPKPAAKPDEPAEESKPAKRKRDDVLDF